MKLIISFLLTTSLLAMAADFTSRCEKFPSKGGFCIHIPNGESSGDVLYYLHSNGNSELTWQDEWYYTAQLRSQWKKQGNRLPIVISVSFGPTWLLAERNSSPNSGFFELFVSETMPRLEKIIGGVKGHRLVLGESMGGMNSIQLAFKTKLFYKAAILCAPMSEVSPFAPDSEIDKHIKSSAAHSYYKDCDPKECDPETVPKSVAKIIQLVKVFYLNDEEWRKGDPIQLAKAPHDQLPKLYVAAGFYDRFAILEGNERFAEILKAKAIDIDWRPQWGGHCAIDIPSLADFLTNE